MLNSIISEKEIAASLGERGNRDGVRKILKRALDINGLSLSEAALLLNSAEDSLDEIFFAASKIKNKIYGRRLVLFTPLYVSNSCTNSCLYCNFRAPNKSLERKTLSLDEIRQEVTNIINEGHRRILIVTGENPIKCGIDYIREVIKTCCETKTPRGEIRRVNVNIAPLSVSDFRKLKSAGIGTYQSFQETYHKETYEKMHPAGKKSDYEWRITAPDRAMEAGIDDVGIGALLGLYDYKFEILAILSHARYLEEKFGPGPHTVSIPRFRYADGSILKEAPYPVSDKDFLKLAAVLRISLPYTGIILTTREAPEIRRKLFSLGVSQISAGSKTTVGGYSHNLEESQQQFQLHDCRSLDEVILDILKEGCIPSFCTACYRSKRTGKDFMSLAKPGKIHEFCHPNALLTFLEYLTNYGSAETKVMGDRVLADSVLEVESPKLRKVLSEKLELVRNGKQDIYL